ncbi:hypothetical protein F8388_023782 [Cannabis sativa]|uniref:Uncharacterized protein n=1 Tax=Cannabis sativa TaxID=3483 RepID=A0A7J6G9Y8_CANSA|nr:hypothetical protein F8388_023782 [Cannabis sativa]
MNSMAMNLVILPNLTLKCSYSSSKTKTQQIPARDRPIDFGKHKGKLLGTLPSNYLKWVSKNLRARDFEHWANLADQVLKDPLYQDRIQWEFAQNILEGNNRSSSISKPVSELLLEMSERFGWDNEDKVGWSRVDFELLGTSKGGRIPRVGGGKSGGKREDLRVDGKEERRKERVRVRGSLGNSDIDSIGNEVMMMRVDERRKEGKIGGKREGLRVEKGGDGKEEGEGRKMKKEEKGRGSLGNSDMMMMMMRLEERKKEGKREDLRVEKGGGGKEEGEERSRREMRRERVMRLSKKEEKGKGSLVNSDVGNEVMMMRLEERKKESEVEVYNPFPGRESLLKKVLQRRKFSL